MANNKKQRNIVFAIVFLLLCPLFYMASSFFYNDYKFLCIGDCVTVDVTDKLGYQDHIWALSSERYENLTLSYSSFLSSAGVFSINRTFTDDNGEKVRLTGQSFDVNKDEISWPFIGDAKLVFKDDRIYLTGNKKILKSSQYEFSRKVDKAAYLLTLVASNHNEDLKPIRLMDGSSIVKKY